MGQNTLGSLCNGCKSHGAGGLDGHLPGSQNAVAAGKLRVKTQDQLLWRSLK
jgi:hypothetical protein